MPLAWRVPPGAGGSRWSKRGSQACRLRGAGPRPPQTASLVLRGSCRLTTKNSGCAPETQDNTVRVASPLTHPHIFGVVSQAPQPFDDGFPVFLPFPFAEHDLQEVPRPADEGHVKQLPFSQDFGTLGGGQSSWRIRTTRSPRARPRRPPPGPAVLGRPRL